MRQLVKSRRFEVGSVSDAFIVGHTRNRRIRDALTTAKECKAIVTEGFSVVPGDRGQTTVVSSGDVERAVVREAAAKKLIAVLQNEQKQTERALSEMTFGALVTVDLRNRGGQQIQGIKNYRGYKNTDRARVDIEARVRGVVIGVSLEAAMLHLEGRYYRTGYYLSRENRIEVPVLDNHGDWNCMIDFPDTPEPTDLISNTALRRIGHPVDEGLTSAVSLRSHIALLMQKAML